MRKNLTIQYDISAKIQFHTKKKIGMRTNLTFTDFFSRLGIYTLTKHASPFSRQFTLNIVSRV